MTTPSTIAIGLSTKEDREILEVAGELDLTNAETLNRALDTTTAHAVIVDLGAVAFIDSAGLRAIDQAHRRFAAAGRALLIVAPPGSTAGWTFAVAGIDATLVLESLEAAAARIEQLEVAG